MNAEILSVLRQRKVVIAIAVALVVVLVWLLAVFNPEGHKLSAVNNSLAQAQSEQATLQDRLSRLRLYSKESATFVALGQKLTAAVPPTTDVYDYITAISDAAKATGVTVTGIAPAAAEPAGGVAVVPVTLTVTGTYDETLAFIKALYALPRLTIINQVSLSGGGGNTNRSSQLTDQFQLSILAQTSALAGKPNA